MVKRTRHAGELLPGCTVRQAAITRVPREEDPMVEAMQVAQVGRHGVRLLIGAALAAFVAFLYLFNFTAFF